MKIQQVAVAFRADAFQEPRRSFDVCEQERDGPRRLRCHIRNYRASRGLRIGVATNPDRGVKRGFESRRSR